MSVPVETSEVPPEASPPDRRADVEAKQALVAGLLRDANCDALLVLEPENFTWLTGGATAWGVLDPSDRPALFFTPEYRWLIASNVDSPRLFDEEIDGLGFQLKEWPWYWGRGQLLSDLGLNRQLACDRPHGDALFVGDVLRERRLLLTPFETDRLRQLGHTLSHALEAACRSLAVGQTEQEVAGHVSHRLMHRHVEPVAIEVAADGRSRRYRQGGFTTAPVQRHCVVSATGRQFGLHASASRSVCFGAPEADYLKEHDAASKVTASYIASSWGNGVVGEILTAGRRLYQITGFEHEWRLSAPGHLTGRAVVERPLTPGSADLLQVGWALTWRARVGAAASCDTYLVTPEGPKAMTAMGGQWTPKRIKIQGGTLSRPDILQR